MSGQLIFDSGPNNVRAEDGSFERVQKAQDIERRHAEEVTQLQLELESLEAVLEKKQVQKKDLEEKLAKSLERFNLKKEMVAKLAQRLQEVNEMISKLRPLAR